MCCSVNCQIKIALRLIIPVLVTSEVNGHFSSYSKRNFSVSEKFYLSKAKSNTVSLSCGNFVFQNSSVNSNRCMKKKWCKTHRGLELSRVLQHIANLPFYGTKWVWLERYSVVTLVNNNQISQLDWPAGLSCGSSSPPELSPIDITFRYKQTDTQIVLQRPVLTILSSHP